MRPSAKIVRMKSTIELSKYVCITQLCSQVSSLLNETAYTATIRLVQNTLAVIEQSAGNESSSPAKCQYRLKYRKCGIAQFSTRFYIKETKLNQLYSMYQIQIPSMCCYIRHHPINLFNRFCNPNPNPNPRLH